MTALPRRLVLRRRMAWKGGGKLNLGKGLKEGENSERESYAATVKALEDHLLWDKLEGDRPCKDKRVYTSSILSTIALCGRQAYLHYVKGIKEQSRNIMGVRGTALHKAVQVLHTQKKFGDWLDVYSECWNDTMDNDAESSLPWSKDLKDTDIEKVYDDGALMLDGYCKENSGVNVIAAEARFLMLIEHPRTGTRYRMTGSIDQIVEMYTDNFQMVDLKSGSNTPNPQFLKLNMQFSAYGLALEKGVFLLPDGGTMEFGKYPNLLVWLHMRNYLPYKRSGRRADGTKFARGDKRGDTMIFVPRSDADYKEFQATACRLVQAVRMNIFPPVANDIVCSMCRFQEPCLHGDGWSEEDIELEV